MNASNEGGDTKRQQESSFEDSRSNDEADSQTPSKNNEDSESLNKLRIKGGKSMDQTLSNGALVVPNGYAMNSDINILESQNSAANFASYEHWLKF